MQYLEGLTYFQFGEIQSPERPKDRSRLSYHMKLVTLIENTAWKQSYLKCTGSRTDSRSQNPSPARGDVQNNRKPKIWYLTLKSIHLCETETTIEGKYSPLPWENSIRLVGFCIKLYYYRLFVFSVFAKYIRTQ